MNTSISFPRLECWNGMTKVATLVAEVDKKRVLCRISLKIMRLKFGASEEEPMKFVAMHRTSIQDAARKLIEAEAYEMDGSILVKGVDL
jgi:hypothetical protein